MNSFILRIKEDHHSEEGLLSSHSSSELHREVTQHSKNSPMSLAVPPFGGL